MGVTHRLGPRPRRVLGAQPAEKRSDPLADVVRCKPRRGPAWGVSPPAHGGGGAGRGGAGTGEGRGLARGFPALGPPIRTSRGSAAPGSAIRRAVEGVAGRRREARRQEVTAQPHGTGAGDPGWRPGLGGASGCVTPASLPGPGPLKWRRRRR